MCTGQESCVVTFCLHLQVDFWRVAGQKSLREVKMVFKYMVLGEENEREGLG